MRIKAFRPTTGVDADADAGGEVQASMRRSILRAFVGRGLLEGFEAQDESGQSVGLTRRHNCL